MKQLRYHQLWSSDCMIFHCHSPPLDRGVCWLLHLRQYPVTCFRVRAAVLPPVPHLQHLSSFRWANHCYTAVGEWLDCTHLKVAASEYLPLVDRSLGRRTARQCVAKLFVVHVGFSLWIASWHSQRDECHVSGVTNILPESYRITQ